MSMKHEHNIKKCCENKHQQIVHYILYDQF